MGFFSIRSMLPSRNISEVHFHTDLSLEECRARLEKSIERKGFAALDPGMSGKVTRNHFYFRQAWSRNSWKVTFEGDLRVDEQGTWINGYYRIPGVTEPFMSCLLLGFGSLILLALLALYVSIFQSWRFQGNPLPFCMPYLPFLIGWPFFLFFMRTLQLAGRAGRESDEQAIEAFLKKTLQADPIK